MVWIQTLDFPLGVCGGLATPCAPRPHSQRNSPKNALTLWSVFFFHVRPIHIPVSLGSRPWIFRWRFAGGWRPPAPPGPTVRGTAQKMRLRSGAFFFFTYDQTTYLFRWDPDPGFSVGGLRGAGDPLPAQLRGAGDPLRPQAPP